MRLLRNLHNNALKVTQQVIIIIANKGHSQSVRPSHSSQTAAMSCHDYPLTSSAPDSCVDKYIIIRSNLGKPNTKNLHPEFLSHFWKQQNNSVMSVGSHSGDIATKKQLLLSSFKLQHTCEGKLHFILACHPSTSKQVSPRHREANVEGSGKGLLQTENILF
jgi:hypothetical protein